MPDPNRVRRAIPHIVYEYANLISSGTLLNQSLEPPCNTHVQDAFLLSCRKLADFFSNRSKPHDVMARHYFPPKRVPKFRLREWTAWKLVMDKQLAHITYGRVDQPVPWDDSKNHVLLSEFRQAWRRFLSELEQPYKTEFDAEIDKRRTSAGYGDLDLR